LGWVVELGLGWLGIDLFFVGDGVGLFLVVWVGFGLGLDIKLIKLIKLINNTNTRFIAIFILNTHKE